MKAESPKRREQTTGRRNRTQLLSIPEVASRLECSKNTVYRFISDGELRAIDIGRKRPKMRVRETDLDRFIESRGEVNTR